MKNKENKEQIKAKMPNSAKKEYTEKYTEQEIQYYFLKSETPYIEEKEEIQEEEKM